MTGDNHGSADTRDVQIPNLLGLHARPAAAFVKVSSGFESEVFVAKGDLEVNGKSIMGVMMLAAECGSVLRIRARGPDHEEVLDALVSLVQGGFGEELADPDTLPDV
ncbi:MAG: HPr family phosphocarrier protein [Gemmatimonadales bacterium]|jgi:phosphocarrier protein